MPRGDARRIPALLGGLARASLVAAALASAPAAAEEREGYYYPPVTSDEVFTRQMLEAGIAPDRALRVAFVGQLAEARAGPCEPPRFAVFAKGAEAEHLIVVALDDAVFRTLPRARAVLALLTAEARSTEFFASHGIETRATWFDLLKVLGFEDLVISDGDTWSHRVAFAD